MNVPWGAIVHSVAKAAVLPAGASSSAAAASGSCGGDMTGSLTAEATGVQDSECPEMQRQRTDDRTACPLAQAQQTPLSALRRSRRHSLRQFLDQLPRDGLRSNA